MSFRVTAPAKLNLFLNVVGRREDGYHLLDSLFAFVELSDEITLERAEKSNLRIDGPFGQGLAVGTDNLVMRALSLTKNIRSITTEYHLILTKNIPVEGGLGGGSADAAAVIVAINQLFSPGLPTLELERFAAQLGADIPACIRRIPVRVKGIGEQLKPVAALPNCGILLVNAGVGAPTPAVFKAFRAQNPMISTRDLKPVADGFGSFQSMVSAIEARGNDLLAPAINIAPIIADVLDALRSLPHVAYASLSGSGSTCFALFETVEDAAQARNHLRQARPDWWSWSGGWAEPS